MVNSSKIYESCIQDVRDLDIQIKELSSKLEKAKNQEQAVEHNKQVNEKDKIF